MPAERPAVLVDDGRACRGSPSFRHPDQLGPGQEGFHEDGQAVAVGGSHADHRLVRIPLGIEADETLMVGDDIRGDIGGAQNAGMRGLLVRTGKYRAEDLQGSIQPDGVIDSIADLPAWWLENQSHE